MTRSHTLGPWHWEDDDFGNYRAIVGDGHVLCEAMQYETESPFINISVPDARLIAAAPELLASLQELLELHIAHHNNPAHVSARAAIAKARGQ